METPRRCKAFFDALALQRLTVTYAEVRLQTDYSEVTPAEVMLDSYFSRRVSVKTPVISAAMDTVTESRMAIALARLGGLGIIHKNLTPSEQGEEVRRVKHHLSGRIAKPITVPPNMTMQQIVNMRRERDFSFHSFPVVDADGRLVGLLTENDFDLCHDFSLQASAVMSRELITGPPGTTVSEARGEMIARKKKVLPLVDSDGTLAGMYLLSDVTRITSGHSSIYNVDAEGRLRVGVAVGVHDDAMRRVQAVMGFADVIVIDTAHGDSKNVIETVGELKSSFNIDVVAGNITRGVSARRLVDAGADGVKVGQGPGSICTTRDVAGIGRPQVSAIYDVAEALEGTDVPICADGGIEKPGDLTIGIGAGAHTLMMGKLLAGTTEAPGDVFYEGGRAMKHYRGMGSLAAMQANRSSRERYGQGGTPTDKLVPEGIEAVVPHMGSLETTMIQYVGGLRAGMAYVGARTIEELRQKADFDRMTEAGIAESHPHGVERSLDATTSGRRAS